MKVILSLIFVISIVVLGIVSFMYFQTYSSIQSGDYDRIESFIISQNFTANADSAKDKLYIIGGIVSEQDDEFLRNNGLVFNENSPSELFRMMQDTSTCLEAF